MSTNINISVGDSKLLDQARQQQAASRQAQLEKEATKRLEAQATDERTKANAAQGKDANGNPLYGVPTPVPSIDRRPAANRQESLGAGAVTGIAYRGFNFPGEYSESDLILRFSSGPNGQEYEFVLPQAPYAPAVDPGESYGPSLNNIPYCGVGLVASSPEQAAVDAESCSVPAYADTMLTNSSSLDTSRFFYFPDGSGGAVIVYYLNNASTFKRQRIRAKREGVYTYWYTIIEVEIPDPGGGVSVTGYVPDINPDCYFPLDQDLGETYYTGVVTWSHNITVIEDTNFTENDVYCFKLAKSGEITQINTPATLASKIRTVLPPVTFTTQSFTSFSENLIDRTYQRTPIPDSCPPNVVDTDTGSIITPYTYSYLTTNEYTAPLWTISDKTLLDYHGALKVNNVRAQICGPSQAAYLLLGLAELTSANAANYDYMENTYYQKKPTYYAALCAVDTCNQSDPKVFLDVSKNRPSTLSANSLPADFKRLKASKIKSPALASSTYTIYYYNWGDPGYCRQLLTALGFAL